MPTDTRVLVLYPWPGLPSADRGSAMRVLPLFQVLRSAGARVTVLSPGDPASDCENNGVLYRYWRPTRCERVACNFLWSLYDSFFFRLTSGKTTARQRRQWWHYLQTSLQPSLGKAIRSRAAEADVILLEYPFWSSLLPREGPPHLLTMLDVLSDMLPEGFLRRRVLRRELTAARFARKTFCVSADDQLRWHSLGVETVLAPHAIIASRTPVAWGRPQEHSLLQKIREHRNKGGKAAFFVGSSLQPNVEAVNVLRRIAKSTGDEWYFVVAGSCSGLEDEGNNFIALGPVSDSDLSELYAICDVFVSPLASGTGASTKILEAMSHAKPVMATNVSVRGYDFVAGRDFLLCSEDHEFVSALRDVSQQPELGERLARRGAEIAKLHEPAKVYAPYVEAVRELTISFV